MAVIKLNATFGNSVKIFFIYILFFYYILQMNLILFYIITLFGVKKKF